ncbi:MAG TPA: PQQ-dependent sugar dehydrogenase [Allosphingosinicella sp.]|nr:PQQ-dependent sugar dehydrogenase [Allosphingosinicella sp.]
MRSIILAALPSLLVAGCNGTGDSVSGANGAVGLAAAPSAGGTPFVVTPVAKYDQPWAMTFLPNGDFLVTEKQGRLRYERAGAARGSGGGIVVQGAPAVDYGGQAGLGDVILHPDFRTNRMIYLSWSEGGPGDTRGAAVGRGRLVQEGNTARLEGFQVIWRQQPKVTGRGHLGHRLAFGPDGKLYITNGEREKFTPAQDPAQTLGKIVRLNADGSVPRDNPWAGRGGVTAQLWTMGHRNPLGIAFDAQGRLWQHEMGPKNGDEFNLIERGKNYGYPIVSNGSHYDGRDIPDHPTRPEFAAPKITWNGVSPASLIIYSGKMFPQWRGDAFLGALSGKALIRVDLDGANAREGQRWDMGQRIREVEEGPDGAIYLLEDERGGSGGRLLRLSRPR